MAACQNHRTTAIGRVLPHDKWNPAVSSRPKGDILGGWLRTFKLLIYRPAQHIAQVRWNNLLELTINNIARHIWFCAFAILEYLDQVFVFNIGLWVDILSFLDIRVEATINGNQLGT